MAYHGADLAAFFSAEVTAAPTRTAMRAIANDVANTWSRTASELTPKDTGRTAEQWRSHPAERIVGGAYQSQIDNPSHVAHWLEFGTEPHEIRPRPTEDGEEGALDTPAGPRESVQHPGTRAYAPLATSAQIIEAEVGRIGQPHVSTWAAEVEAAAKRGKGYQ